MDGDSRLPGLAYAFGSSTFASWWSHCLYVIAKGYLDHGSLMMLAFLSLVCKAQSTRTFEFCAREAAQIFGGLSYTRGGQGERIERLNREVRAYSVPGGSEEIMLELGIRQSTKIASFMGAKM